MSRCSADLWHDLFVKRNAKLMQAITPYCWESKKILIIGMEHRLVIFAVSMSRLIPAKTGKLGKKIPKLNQRFLLVNRNDILLNSAQTGEGPC